MICDNSTRGDKATGAVPFGTLVALLVVWFCISLPLVFVGSFLGFRTGPWDHPVRTNSIPRQVTPPCSIDGYLRPQPQPLNPHLRP